MRKNWLRKKLRAARGHRKGKSVSKESPKRSGRHLVACYLLIVEAVRKIGESELLFDDLKTNEFRLKIYQFHYFTTTTK